MHMGLCKQLLKQKLKCSGKVAYVKAGRCANKESVLQKIEMIELENFGNEDGEKMEIKRKYGWSSVNGGIHKFYSSNLDEYAWYYFVYFSSKSTNEVNEFASRCCGTKIRGDIVILKSGPMGIDYDELFTKEDLYNAYIFYETHNLLFSDKGECQSMQLYYFCLESRIIE